MPLKKQDKASAKPRGLPRLPASAKKQKVAEAVLPTKPAPSEKTAESTQTLVNRIPADIPSSYADQIMDIVYGVHTSKLIFGDETGSSVRPVRVVVIPTASLLIAATRVLDNLSAAGMIEETTKRYGGIIRTMHELSSQIGKISGGDIDVPVPKRRS